MARKQFTKTEIRRALRKVRTKLLNGKIGKAEFDIAEPLRAGPDRNKPLCGSIGCIGGYTAMELDPKRLARAYQPEFDCGLRSEAADMMREMSDLIPNLYDLFYGFGDVRGAITRRRAAAAITRALDGAEDPWKTGRR